MSVVTSLYCIACQTRYNNQRSLSMHLNQSQYCIQTLTNFQNHIQTHTHSKEDLSLNLSQSIEQKTTQELQNNSLLEDDIKFCELDKEEIENGQESMSDTSSVDNKTLHYSDNIIHEVKLLQIINELGTPLYAYKTILDWAKEAQLSNYNFESQHGTYQQTINFLEHKLLLGITRPQTIPVDMYKDNMKIDVVVFDVKKMLLSLFDNKDLNKQENLVVNMTNPFSRYTTCDNLLGEVNSGKWYQTAYDKCITDPESEFLCPIILASDKTTISEMGDLHVDAIFMTTSLFDYKVRMQTVIFFYICFQLVLDKK